MSPDCRLEMLGGTSQDVYISGWAKLSQVSHLKLLSERLKTNASQVCERTRLKTKATRNGRGHLELDASQDGGRVLRPARLETRLGRLKMWGSS